MADQVVTTYLNQSGYEGFKAAVFTTEMIGYYIYKETPGGALRYRKTTDGGSSWSGAITISGGSNATVLSVWYDRWTPGDDTGTKIHIVHAGGPGNNFAMVYATLDTAGDVALAGPLLVNAVHSAGQTTVGIVKARNGNLYVFGKYGTGNWRLRRSIDGGATWTTRATFDSTFMDCFAIEPGNESDSADFWIFFTRPSSGQMEMQAYFNATDTWSSLVVVFDSGGTGPIVDQRMNTVTRRSNNFTYMAFTTGLGNGDQLRVFRIESRATIVTLPTIVSGAFSQHISITLNPIANHLYVVRMDINGNIYYYRSTDLGSTWDAAVLIPSAGPYTGTIGTRLSPILASGGRFYPFWANQDTSTVRTLRANFTTSIVLAPPAPPSGLGGAGAAKALLDLF